ncbi:hypothetical protein [Methylocucumis oryzae]|uniref:hypothetical protein n=1 Tax=Methylocucumis oryzae TaxID=1632867 RepID=UPI00103B9BEC|nr:hypothetical protein [Methylocucumis oryzae]
MLLQELRERKIEHLHMHFGTNSACVGLLCRYLGGPSYSITIHGPEEFDAPLGLSLADKISASAFVLAISDFGSSQIRRWIPLSEWKKSKYYTLYRRRKLRRSSDAY